MRITDIQNGKVNWDTVPFTTVKSPDPYILKRGDIVFARTGATVGKSYLLSDIPYDSVYASYLIRIRLLDCVLPEFIYQFFNSDQYWDQITDKSVGVGQPNCNGTSLKNLLLPLAPLSEQQKIVPVANDLISLVSNIDSERNVILDDITQLKSKILDLAIRGQLVPQDPNDEPGSVLLDRIRAEKEALIKAGKIKRDKKESVIFKGEDNSYYEKIGGETVCIDDQIPFDIPNNWCWTRLKNITDIVMGSSPQGDNVTYDKSYLEFHQGKLFFTDYIIGNSHQYTKEITKISERGSVLLCVRAPVGEVNITDRDICIGRGLSSIHPNPETDVAFLFYWLQSYKKELNNKATGSTFSAVTSDIVRSLLIPMPPKQEQQRILSTIKKTVKVLNNIEASLA